MDDAQQANRLGNFIIYRRQELRLSLRSLAERADMNPGTLHRIETSATRINVSREVLVRLARALELPISDLITQQSVASEDLPELNVYLRAKFDMTDTEIAEMTDYLSKRRGSTGPVDGEDER